MALMPVADALAAILAGAEPLPEEMVALDAAYHRVLARDVAALRTQPPQAMSAMDGYAVRAADAADVAARLKVIGEVAAGRPFDTDGRRRRSGADFHRRRDPRRRRRRHHPGRHRASTATASPSPRPPSPGRHIRPAGVDFREGDVLLAGGQPPHRPRPVAGRRHELSGTAGAPPAEGRGARHRRRTGDAGRDARPRPDRLFQRLCAAGAGARRGRRDHRSRHRRRHASRPPRDGIRRARDSGADILITTGGASVGDHDLVKQSLEAEGVTMAFWRIAMRPGKPMMHGRLGAMRVIGLPGNPVSSYVCGFLFLVPLIRALSGRSDIHHVARDGAARARSRRQRPARGLSARPAGGARRRRADRHAGQPSGQFAAGKSRCGTGTCDPSAVCARGRRGLALRASCGCPAETPERARPGKTSFAFTRN